MRALLLCLLALPAHADTDRFFRECCELRGVTDVTECRKDPEMVKLCDAGADPFFEEIRREGKTEAGSPSLQEALEWSRRVDLGTEKSLLQARDGLRQAESRRVRTPKE